MSWLSQILKQKTGLPEVDLLKKKDPVIGALLEQLAGQKVGGLLKKLPDDALALLLKAAKDETRRRLDDV